MFYYNVQVSNRLNTFTYKSEVDILLGTKCIIPLKNKTEEGYVVSKSKRTEYDYDVKKIEKILDIRLNNNLFELINFIHKYYLAPYSSLISLIDRYNCIDKIEPEKLDIKRTYILNSCQKNVSDNISNSKNSFHLIHGITGSGKTQVYIDLMIKALNEGKSCILLLPEISLTPQFLKKLELIFEDKIAIWHSKLTKKKKENYEEGLKSGKIRLILGTRSAIFQYIHNLAYIIIDEEQEDTYKQDLTNPRYHIKNVAIKRCMLEGAKLVLGSATPSFETYYQAENKMIEKHVLNSRYNGANLPEYTLVDLNQYDNNITDILINKIRDRIQKKEQVIILLNRKAHSTSVKCIDCNNVFECKKCSYKLVYFSKKNILQCNQCETTYTYKDRCISCNSSNLEKYGIGTEKLENQISELFDEDRILRMDSETMNTSRKIHKAYKDFSDNKYDILIGTSIIAKGFHFPNVTLVCILNADQLMQVPDFKVIEKTYQLITQAAGRSGRGEKKGEVLIQTFNTDSDLISAVINNSYDRIYDNQINFRKMLNLPPIKKSIKITFTDKNESRLSGLSNYIRNLIASKINDVSVVTPISNSIIYKVSNRYRKNFSIFFDKKDENCVKLNINKIIRSVKISSGSKIIIDVDPVSLI